MPCIDARNTTEQEMGSREACASSDATRSSLKRICFQLKRRWELGTVAFNKYTALTVVCWNRPSGTITVRNRKCVGILNAQILISGVATLPGIAFNFPSFTELAKGP